MYTHIHTSSQGIHIPNELSGEILDRLSTETSPLSFVATPEAVGSGDGGVGNDQSIHRTVGPAENSCYVFLTLLCQVRGDFYE